MCLVIKRNNAVQVADSGATLNTNQLFIFEATQQMFRGLADLLSFVEKFSTIFGQVRARASGSRTPALMH